MKEQNPFFDEGEKTKADRRTEKRHKEQNGPTGGSWAGQEKRAEVNRGYQGVPRALKPSVHVYLPGEKEKLEEEKKKKKKKK